MRRVSLGGPVNRGSIGGLQAIAAGVSQVRAKTLPPSKRGAAAAATPRPSWVPGERWEHRGGSPFGWHLTVQLLGLKSRKVSALQGGFKNRGQSKEMGLPFFRIR